MGKGNKVRKREIKKPKQDKAQKAAAKAAKAIAGANRTYNASTPTQPRTSFPQQAAPQPAPIVRPSAAA